MTHGLLVWLLAIGVVLGSLFVTWVIIVIVGFTIVFTRTIREPKPSKLNLTQDHVDKLIKEWLDVEKPLQGEQNKKGTM